MIESATIDGRPCSVMYINDAFEPVSEAEATLARVIFTDEQGGSMFLVMKEPEPEATKQ